MDIKKAVQRIGWRFGGNDNKKPFPVNETDIEAYNAIVNFVKAQQEKQFEANQLFAKLYIFVYMRFISKMGATVMDTAPRKAIHKIFEKPIEQWIEEFKDEMNDSEMYSLLEKMGIEMKHPALITETERNSNTEKAKPIAKQLTEKVWDYETVKECLTSEINNAINKYR